MSQLRAPTNTTESGDLAGRIALVTGSTRGIGWATAQHLAGRGARVIINAAHDLAAAQRRVDEIEASGGTAEAVACDASDPDQIKQLHQQIFKTHRQLDILVNNAGVMLDAVIGMITPAVIQDNLAVNVTGALLHLQSAAKLMQRNGGGSIVNLTSIVGAQGKEGQTAYSAAKAAVIGMTLSAAKELAPKNIRVNAVAPGFIATDLVAGLPAEKASAVVADIGLGRPGQASDVASVIGFLCSDAASYVTGQVLGVDGGMRL